MHDSNITDKMMMYCRKLVDQGWILRTFLIRFIIQNEAVMFSMHPYEEIRFKTWLNSFRQSFVKKGAYKPVLKTLGILSAITWVAPGKSVVLTILWVSTAKKPAFRWKTYADLFTNLLLTISKIMKNTFRRV